MTALVTGIAAAQQFDYARRPGFWEELAKAQRPGVAVICCSDSRAAPEHVTRADPGTLFVQRSVAGLVPTPPGKVEAAWLKLYHNATRRLGVRDLAGAWYGPWAAIEFPVVQLDVPNILVLGHSGCGGVGLAMQKRGARAELPDTDSWVDMVRPIVQAAVRAAGPDEAAQRYAGERAAVLWSARNLLLHERIAARVKAGKTRVYAGHYNIATGAVELWDPLAWRFRDAREHPPGICEETLRAAKPCAAQCRCIDRLPVLPRAIAPADRR